MLRKTFIVLIISIISYGSILFALVSVPGIEVGHYQFTDQYTGCTVILVRDGAVAGVSVAGGAPGTRETDLLNPINPERKIHAISLSGGSAFGLDSASGVVRYLAEKSIGYQSNQAVIPLVPAAIINDLTLNPSNIANYERCGYYAAQSANNTVIAQGNHGAGTGATVGKSLSLEYAMKGGVGTHSIQLENGLIVAALIVVNALGDVINPASNQVLAGVYDQATASLLDSRKLISNGLLSKTPATLNNTTIGVIATNATLTPAQATVMANMAQAGMTRTIAPIHTPYDGDALFVLATGAWHDESHHMMTTTLLGELAAQAVAEAIINAVCSAEPVAEVTAAQQIYSC